MLLKGQDITTIEQAERVKLGIARTFQINRLFRGLSVLENVYIAVAERVGAGAEHVHARRHAPGRDRRGDGAARRAQARRRSPHKTIPELPYGRQRLVELAIALGLEARGAAARRAGRRRAERREPHHPRRHRRAAEEHRRADHRPRHGPGVPLRQEDHGAGARRGVRRGHAEGDRRQPATCAPSISGRPRMASALELQGRVGRLRRDRGAGGHQPRARAGREHQHDRAQRRRQDHAARDHHGPHHAAQGRGAARRARASTACRSIAAPPPGLGFVPQEREIFPVAAACARISRSARGPATGPRSGCSSCSRTCKERLDNTRQPALRRRAADAVDRARAAHQSDRAADGRADRGPRAGDRRDADRRAGEAAQRERAVDHPGRAEQPRRASSSPTRSVVLDKGRIVYDGASAALRDDPERLAKIIGVSE